MASISKSVQFGIALSAAVALSLPTAGWGQAAKGKKAAPGGAVEIEEITVTAQKREESLQETPISITAVTGAVLQEKQVTSVVDLNQVVPNLHVTGFTGSNSSMTISIRGVAQADNEIALTPTVGLYVDGAYISKIMGSNLDLEDLERVEVLRGPQGTLYGRNTIGGAANFITKKPTEERAITLGTEAGNFEAFKGRLTLNVPLIGKNGFFQSDAIGTLSLRENVVYQNHDGYYRNRGRGVRMYDNLNRITTMTSLRWQPTKDITIDYSGEYHRYNNGSTAFQVSYVYPGGAPDAMGLSAYLHPNRVDSIPTSSLTKPDPNGTRTNLQQADLGNHRMHILTGAWDLGEVGPLGSVTVRSISSYRNLSLHQDQDLSGSPLQLGQFGLRDQIEQWSEELQWVGTAPRVHYVLGGYYYGEHAKQDSNTLVFGGSVSLFATNRIETESVAPYGQVTVTPPILNDKLSVTVGMRYTHEQVHFRRNFYCLFIYGGPGFNLCNNPAVPVPGLQNMSAEAGKGFGIHGSGAPGLSPMGDISFQWTDELMTYFRVSRGFKSGTFTGTSNIAEIVTNPVNPERLLAYEGGFKSQWLDNRLRINGSGFFEDYTDQQIGVFRASKFAGPQVSLENAGKSEIWGAEMEMVAAPLRGLEATASYSYVAPKFTEFLEQAFDANNQPIIGQTVNVAKERKFALAPENTFTIGLSYTAPPTDFGTFSIRGDTYWQDKVLFAPVDYTHDAGGSYAVVNGRMQLADIPLAKGSLDIGVFARNLFDRKYRVFGIDFGDPATGGLGWAGNKYGQPRTFGVGLTYHFTAS